HGGLSRPAGRGRSFIPAFRPRGSADPNGRRAAAVGFPAVGVRLRGAVFHRPPVARIRRRGVPGGTGGVRRPSATLRKSGGCGGWAGILIPSETPLEG